MSDIKPLIGKVAEGTPLSRDESRSAFEFLMSGEATPAQIGGLLMALRVRGETIDEIAGAVSVMRDKMLKVAAPTDAMDIVGTGGDAKGTQNISTCTSFVVAGAGVPIAKHGNRALSSRSGAADVLAALGVKLDLSPEQITWCIEGAGIGFMFAPAHHAAMKHVGPSRVDLGTRTIFNLLGPLSNPAGVKRQLLGVFSARWVEPLAHALKDLGTEAAWIVHGASGADEITLSGSNIMAELRDGEIRTFMLTADDFGLPEAPIDTLKGGDAQENAAALRGVLSGEASPYGDVVLANAAAALVVAGRVSDLISGVAAAREAIQTGAAIDRLNRLIEISNA